MADLKAQLEVVKAIEKYYNRKINYFAFKRPIFDKSRASIEVKFKP